MKRSDIDARNEKQVYGLLSLCRKAGKVKSGGQILYDSIASGEARLVLIAGDASDNTRKKCLDKCAYRHVPAVVFGTMEEMGHALGMTDRAAVAVTDAGFAGEIRKKIGGETNGKDEDI